MPQKIFIAADKAKPNELLMLFLANKGKYLSGEIISKKFGITRSAIWKQVKNLRDMGYKIQSSPRLGYCLVEIPNLLIPEQIWAASDLKVMGKKIYYYSSIDSTNKVAKELGRQGAPDGTIVIAEMQQQGRGRMGRMWESPVGGLWFSVIIRPDISPARAPSFTIMTAVAVAEAIRETAGKDIGIKWPNDILAAGKKVCGILTEMSGEMDVVNYIVIGIGVNVNNDEFPEGLKDKATSLKKIKGENINKLRVLCAILKKLEYYYCQALSEGFKKIFDKWSLLCVNLGREVKVVGKDKSILGKAVAIDEDGALQVKTNDGKIVRVLSGDVSLR